MPKEKILRHDKRYLLVQITEKANKENLVWIKSYYKRPCSYWKEIILDAK